MTMLFFACTNLLISFAFSQESESPSIAETIPDHLAYLYAPVPESDDPKKKRQLYAGSRTWENGRPLRVCFFGGNKIVTKLIRETASEWNNYSGVKFDFGPQNGWYNCRSPSAGFSEIRVAFGGNGYWSYIGTDSETEAVDRAPSMNLQRFNLIYNQHDGELNPLKKVDPYHKAVIKHEFGHALGLLHEHQNPSLNCISEIKMTGPGNVYEYYGGNPNHWSKEDVDRNLGFIGLEDPDYIAGEPDLKSIMLYRLDPKILVGGSSSKCATEVSYLISERDKALISKLYPVDIAKAGVVDNDLKKAVVQAPPAISRGIIDTDYLQRLKNDLQSDDVAIRRNARSRLTAYIASDASSNVASQVILDLPSQNYRYKIGVTTGLANLTDPIEVSDKAAEVFEKQKNLAKDPVLIKNFSRAQEKVSIE